MITRVYYNLVLPMQSINGVKDWLLELEITVNVSFPQRCLGSPNNKH